MAKLKATRRSKGLSQLDVAYLINKSRGQIANLESGKFNCSMPLFLQWVKVLGLEWADFEEGAISQQEAKDTIKALKEDVKKFHEDIMRVCLKNFDLYMGENDGT